MNFGEFKQRVKDIVARNNLELDNVILMFTNEILDEIQKFYNFEFLKQTIELQVVAGQRTYSLPANFKDDIIFYLVKENKYEKLTLTNSYEIIKKVIPEETGEPKYIVIERDMFSLFPAPDKDYVLRITYYAYFSPISSDTDTNYILDKEVDVLLNGVLQRVFSYLFEYEQAQYYGQIYQQKLLLLKRREVIKELPTEMSLGVYTDVKKSLLE